MSELISVREFARRVGCSDVAVHKAIKSQKIVKGFVYGKDGKGKIDPEVAAQEWGKNFDPNYTSNPKLRQTIGEAAGSSIPEDSVATRSGSSIADAKRAQAILKAKLLDIELKEKQGKLVDKALVYQSLFAAGQEVRAAILAVPDRIIDTLMACDTRNEAHTMLLGALIDALETVSDMEGKDVIK